MRRDFKQGEQPLEALLTTTMPGVDSATGLAKETVTFRSVNRPENPQMWISLVTLLRQDDGDPSGNVNNGWCEQCS